VEAARIATCNAQADYDSAKAWQDSSYRAWIGTVATAAALLAASYNALLIPFFGAGIAAGTPLDSSTQSPN
jgi:hypothetical protein